MKATGTTMQTLEHCTTRRQTRARRTLACGFAAEKSLAKRHGFLAGNNYGFCSHSHSGGFRPIASPATCKISLLITIQADGRSMASV